MKQPTDRMLIDALCIVLGCQIQARDEYEDLLADIPRGTAVRAKAEEIIKAEKNRSTVRR